MLFALRKVTIAVAFSFLLLIAAAQADHRIQPVSESLPEHFLNLPEEIILTEFNADEIKLLDQADAKNGELPKFSRSVFTNIHLDNAGSWTPLPNGDRVWRVQVTSSGAQALLPYFNKFYLPPGSSLHVYSPDRKETIGAFTFDNNPNDGFYAAGLIHGESFILEYFEPYEAKGKGVISLNEVGHAYRWVNRYFPKNDSRVDTLGFNDSGACEVNVNCSEGTAWQNQKRSVVCMIVKDQLGQGICSGTLINNVRQDCTPYLLSAQHCSRETLASQFSQWLFYFNFESPVCSDPAIAGNLDDNFMVGCTRKADSNDDGGDNGSDFILLELNNSPPLSYNIHYSGWDASNTASLSGVCIHHPEGDIKKISTYTTILRSTTWKVPSSVQNTHWEVRWSATANGHGVTEVGSSGAPLYNDLGQVIGKLSGGQAYCTSPTLPDLCGKLAYDWVSNGAFANRQLKPWLDPDNTGVLFMNGRNGNCALSVDDAQNDEILFEVFPNPSNGIYMLRFSKEDEKTVRILDATGKKVFERKTVDRNMTVDISGQQRGIYILQIESLRGVGIKKIVMN